MRCVGNTAGRDGQCRVTHVNSSRPLDGPWRPLTEVELAKVPAQLGVFQLADEQGAVQRIGYAGAREPFGMRSALKRFLCPGASAAGTTPDTPTPKRQPQRFRYEFTANYASRYDELLMRHIAAHGQLPDAQRHEQARVGRLSGAS